MDVVRPGFMPLGDGVLTTRLFVGEVNAMLGIGLSVIGACFTFVVFALYSQLITLTCCVALSYDNSTLGTPSDQDQLQCITQTHLLFRNQHRITNHHPWQTGVEMVRCRE